MRRTGATAIRRGHLEGAVGPGEAAEAEAVEAEVRPGEAGEGGSGTADGGTVNRSPRGGIPGQRRRDAGHGGDRQHPWGNSGRASWVRVGASSRPGPRSDPVLDGERDGGCAGDTPLLPRLEPVLRPWGLEAARSVPVVAGIAAGAPLRLDPVAVTGGRLGRAGAETMGVRPAGATGRRRGGAGVLARGVEGDRDPAGR